MQRLLSFLLLLTIIKISAKAQQGTQIPYNRIQYQNLKWKTFHTPMFHIYFPQGYDSLCAFTAKEMLPSMELVRQRMGTQLQPVPNIIIYPSIAHLYQSNIGSFEPAEYTLPTIVLKGTRLLLYFTGDHEALKAQLREALVRTAWEEAFKGEDLGSQAKGAIKDDKLPYWFTEGMISYFAHDWTIQNEDQLRAIYKSNTPQSWDAIIGSNQKLAGQALCYFLSVKYYRQAPIGLYYQLKKKGSLPRAIRLIAKAPLDSVMEGCYRFYQARFNADQSDNIAIAPISSLFLLHKKCWMKSLLVSPDQRHIAYITAEFHKRTVWLYNTATEEKEKLYTYHLPPWLTHHSQDVYPLLSWNKEGELIVTVPEEGKLKIKRYSINGSKLQDNTLYGVDGMTSMAPTGKGDYLVSAFRKGQSDIVSYNDRREKYTTITDDYYDDKAPARNEETGEVAFVSKRPVDAGKDIYGRDSFALKQGIFTKDKQVNPIITSDSSFALLDKPLWLYGNKLLFNNALTGAERFAIWNNGSVSTLSLSQTYQYNQNKQQISFPEPGKDSSKITTYNFTDWQESQRRDEIKPSPWLLDDYSRRAYKAKEDSILNAAKSSEPSFLDGVLLPKDAKAQSSKRKDSIERSVLYDSKKVSSYILQLHSAYFTARVNNDFFINRYQPYLNYQGQFKFPEPGGMAKGGFTDLFENHHISIAYRMPAGTEGSDFFVQYRNTAKRKDWSLMWFRKVESLKPDPKQRWEDNQGRTYPSAAKVKTNYYEGSLHIPLDYYLSVDLTEAIRHDRTVFLATERYSLRFDDINSLWSITTASTTWNKLQRTLPLLYKGYMVKGRADLFKGFSQEKEILYGLGIDASYHKPIYKYITSVVRAQAGYSGGNKKLLYNLGGIDNNLTVRKDTSVQFSQYAPYAFQTLVTPLRGHLQNTVVGNQYALLNMDVYFPIFQTLIPIETELSSINNLQLGLFSDVAYAKESWRSANNSTQVWSYGLGARTKLASYPIRFDIAWPGSFDKKPVWYLSLSIQ